MADILPDTKVLKTPSGEHDVTFRAYITGEDRRMQRRLLLKLSDEGKTGKAESLEESEDALIKQVVLDVDGSSDDIVAKVLKMRVQDYEFVIFTVNEIIEGLSDKKKAISDGSTSHSSEEKK